MSLSSSGITRRCQNCCRLRSVELRIEFGQLDLTDQPIADFLVLAGDIGIKRVVDLLIENVDQTDNRYHLFMQNVSKKYSHVVYVIGSHEHYHGNFSNTVANLRKKFSYLPNVHILDNETFEYGDIIFIGSTLWADFNGNDPTTLKEVRYLMNDFALIGNGEEEFFNPEDALAEHQKSLEFIQQAYTEIDGAKKIVMVSHHALTFYYIQLDRNDEYYLNGGYATDLRHFIEQHNRIKFWLHAHTHSQVEYEGVTPV